MTNRRVRWRSCRPSTPSVVDNRSSTLIWNKVSRGKLSRMFATTRPEWLFGDSWARSNTASIFLRSSGIWRGGMLYAPEANKPIRQCSPTTLPCSSRCLIATQSRYAGRCTLERALALVISRSKLKPGRSTPTPDTQLSARARASGPPCRTPSPEPSTKWRAAPSTPSSANWQDAINRK